MVAIPGLGNLGGMFSGMGATFIKGIGWFMVVLVIMVIIGYFVWGAMQKKKYNQKVSAIYLSENKERVRKRVYGLKGGITLNSVGVRDFAVKIPGTFRPKILGFTPDFTKANDDGELVFIVSGDGSLWQQTQEKVITRRELIRDISDEEMVEVAEQIRVRIQKKEPTISDEALNNQINKELKDYVEANSRITENIILEPVSSNVKTATINQIKDVINITGSNKTINTVIGGLIGGVIIMVIGHLIWTWIVVKRLGA